MRYSTKMAHRPEVDQENIQVNKDIDDHMDADKKPDEDEKQGHEEEIDVVE